MLKFFRDQKNSWLMKGILILTALSFVSLFGTGRFLEEIPDESKPVAVVAGRKITVAQFVDEVNRQVRSIEKMTRQPFSVRDAVDSGLLMSMLNRMVSRAVTEKAVDTLGLTVSDESVRAAIAALPMFTDYDGKFSLSAYKQYLSDAGIREKDFVADTFLDMRARQLTGAAAALSGVGDKTVDVAYRLENEIRSADVFTIAPEKLQIRGKPSDADRERLYKELGDELIAPEKRSFTVFFLTLDDVSKKIKITDEDLREVFNENKDAYATEEIRDVDQMLFDTKEDADKAFAALKKGGDFMAVAKKYAHQTEDQTKLGDLTPSTATGDWADAVFSAKKGEIVAPVQTAFGWQILRVNKITPKVEKRFADVRDEIERKMVASLAFDALSETAVALDDRFGAGETIEEVARSTGFPMKKYEMVDPSGLNENGKSAGVSKAVLEQAFVADPGRETPMTEDGSDFFVLRVDDVRDPALKPLEKAQKEIETAWIKERRRDKARRIADEIKAALNKGAAPAVVAKKTGADYKRVAKITRNGGQLSQAATYRLFGRPVGEVFSLPEGENMLVVKAVKSIPADPAKNKTAVAELRGRMRGAAAAEKADVLLSDFSAWLKLEIKEGTVQKAFAYLTKSTQESDEDY